MEMLNRIAFEIGKAIIIVATLELSKVVLDHIVSKAQKRMDMEDGPKIVDSDGNVIANGEVVFENGTPTVVFK